MLLQLHDITSDDSKTVVFYAKQHNNMAKLCALINGGGEFNLDEIDATPVLFSAAKNNFPIVVERLFDGGCDLNTTDDEDKTAVFHANHI